jgi:hypothetical protein
MCAAPPDRSIAWSTHSTYAVAGGYLLLSPYCSWFMPLYQSTATRRLRETLRDPLHAMQFRPSPPPRSETGTQPNGLLQVTVIVRWIPLVTAAYGTRVARPARTTMLGPRSNGSSSARG